jgi:hypothetical protein
MRHIIIYNIISIQKPIFLVFRSCGSEKKWDGKCLCCFATHATGWPVHPNQYAPIKCRRPSMDLLIGDGERLLSGFVQAFGMGTAFDSMD